MPFLDLLCTLEKMNKQAEREQIRQARINAKIEDANRRAYEKQQKINYINSQEMMANDLTTQIFNQYRIYDLFKNNILSSKQFFSFNAFKKKFIEGIFVFNVPVPVKRSNAEKIKIPNEMGLENKLSFLKKRRLKIQEKKKNLENLENEEYNLLMNRYEYEKNLAFEQFKRNEENRKNDILNYNNNIDNWKNGCLNYDKECIDGYLARLFNFFIQYTNNKLVNKIKYDYSNKKIILEIFMKKEKDLFPCEGYRYYKQRDSIEPIKTKKTTINAMLKEIIPNVAVSFADILYKNDELNLFNDVIINVYYERKCCSTLKLNRDLYFKMNLLVEDNYYYVYDNYMKNYKTLSTGVKPYETIYVSLV